MLVVIAGATLIWTSSGRSLIFNGLMDIPNLIAVLAFRSRRRLTKRISVKRGQHHEGIRQPCLFYIRRNALEKNRRLGVKIALPATFALIFKEENKRSAGRRTGFFVYFSVEAQN